MVNLNNVVNFLIWLLPLVPFATLILYGKKWMSDLENRFIPVAQQDHIKSIVRTVVQAVEQVSPMMLGPQKRSEAVRLISQLLSEHNIQISPVMLDTLIEQAVFLMKQGKDPSQSQVLQAVGQVVSGQAPISIPVSK